MRKDKPAREQRRYGIDINPLTQKLKDELRIKDEELADRYWKRTNVEEILSERTQAFDRIITNIWQQIVPEDSKDDLALLALGGYARQELFPKSDIDLLIICTKAKKHESHISQFLHNLYDLNLEIGHAVRSLRECVRAAKDDITAATAMFEQRYLAGSRELASALEIQLKSPQIWPPAKFYKAKCAEQQ